MATDRRTLLPLLTPRAALGVGALGFAMEVVAITPWFDTWAEENSTFHFSQHGLIFLGGVVMGWALRDLRLVTIIAGRR